eukprot:TRINITY_DN50638_c0_g1_i1.p1 TRINITY_DN50638_c0_g1~~TRINITY_DN50638_c0_g1_i1.p1  ORF type:complete len:321 (+),score=48.66 TRINITY_DN50638_c0_g1_i1:25-963(+)
MTACGSSMSRTLISKPSVSAEVVHRHGVISMLDQFNLHSSEGRGVGASTVASAASYQSLSDQQSLVVPVLPVSAMQDPGGLYNVPLLSGQCRPQQPEASCEASVGQDWHNKQEQQKLERNSSTLHPNGGEDKIALFPYLLQKPVAQISSELETSPLLDGDVDAPMESEEELDIILGPTGEATWPLSLQDAWMSSILKGKSSVESNSRYLKLTDILGLSSGEHAQLSFGSLLHARSDQITCRPCMFERCPKHCRRVWLCDFCHFHRNEKRIPRRPRKHQKPPGGSNGRVTTSNSSYGTSATAASHELQKLDTL